MSRARDLADGTFSGAFEADSPTLVVDAANNRVGVGTATPAGTLDVSQSTAGTARHYLRNTSSSVGAYTILDLVNDTGANIGEFFCTSSTNTSSFGTNATVLQAATSNPLILGTNGSERARIDSSGNFFINATTFPAVGVEKFGVNGGSTIAGAFATNTNTNASVFIANGFDGTSTLVQFAGGPLGNFVGTITTNGTTTAYNTSSDYRLKENVVPLAGAADRLMQIPVCRFNFTADPDRTVDGFLAHEVQAFVPECVTGEKDQVETVDVTDEDGNVIGTEERPVYQGIDQSKLVPLLTAALKEALADIATLKAEVAALKGSA